MTKNSQAVLIAAERGFFVDGDGIARKPSGEIQTTCIPARSDNQYRSFGISCFGTRHHVKVHRLVAFQKFGIAALLEGVHTRHLNGDSLDNRPENIAIGTAQENSMDRSPEDRRSHAKKAVSARSLPDSVWEEIRERHESGMSFKAIRSEYGIALGTLSYRLSKTAKKKAVA